MPAHTTATTKDDEAIARRRNALVLDQARASGLLGALKDTKFSSRVSSELVAAAKQRAHVSSDAELLELALSRLALEDDFGAKLVRRKGTLPRDLDLAI